MPISVASKMDQRQQPPWGPCDSPVWVCNFDKDAGTGGPASDEKRNEE